MTAPYRATGWRNNQCIEHMFWREKDALTWARGCEQSRPWRIQARRGAVWQTMYSHRGGDR